MPADIKIEILLGSDGAVVSICRPASGGFDIVHAAPSPSAAGPIPPPPEIRNNQEEYLVTVPDPPFAVEREGAVGEWAIPAPPEMQEEVEGTEAPIPPPPGK